MKLRPSFISDFSSLFLILVLGVLMPGICWSQETQVQPDIYSGFYSRAENYGKVAKTSGHSHFIKFYPDNRITRLYIPFPYSKTLSTDTINTVLDTATAKTYKSAYIKDKFGLLKEQAVAHLDFIHQVDGVTMYDCGKPTPCKILFEPEYMTIITPGIVMELEIRWAKVETVNGN